ncbi:MAG: hypothetical protein O3B84_00300 [Chloroflexi bacterium]|nr:hypothetical protein [Chloroflexota bacterium]
MPEFNEAAGEDAESAAWRVEHLPEDDNPTLIDAHRTFVLTLFSVAAFVGVVISFIL